MFRSLQRPLVGLLTVVSVSLCASRVSAATPAELCKDLPSYDQFKSALVAAKSAANGGFNLEMWGTLVNRDGIICAIAYTGKDHSEQWPGSRTISAAKAYTANAFSLPSLSVSTANLYFATQPGGSLFGLANGNPLDTSSAYRGYATKFGQADDPLVGDRIGGTIVFGGGLALYNAEHKIVGGIGVSGDSACADHSIAWRTRNALKLDYVPAGVSGQPTLPDNIVYDIGKITGASSSGWGHPACTNAVAAMSKTLPATRK